MEEQEVFSDISQEVEALQESECISQEVEVLQESESISRESENISGAAEDGIEAINTEDESQINPEGFKTILKNMAASYALLAAGAKNVVAARALIDTNLIEVNLQTGEAQGIDEQIEALKKGEDTYFLFENDNAYVPQEGNGDMDTDNMSYKQLCEYFDNK